MSGHSKWANIKRRKGKQDAARGKIFTKIIREITVAARMGGEDINGNPRLRLVVDKALSQNMTKDTIDRAIKRGAGGEEGNGMESIWYEGYGPAGVAILVECLTDNRNRTVSEVRHTFSKRGGNLGTSGSVSYLFKDQGIITVNQVVSEEKLIEIALNAGAEDVNYDEDEAEITCSPEVFFEVKQALEKEQIACEGEIIKVASLRNALNKENSLKIMDLIEDLENLDDVQNVYTNGDLAEEALT